MSSASRAAMGQTFTFRLPSERRLLIAEVDQALTSQECQTETFLNLGARCRPASEAIPFISVVVLYGATWNNSKAGTSSFGSSAQSLNRVGR